MIFEFMTIDTPLPPCMAFPRALTGFPVSSTAKIMYCRMLDASLLHLKKSVGLLHGDAAHRGGIIGFRVFGFRQLVFQQIVCADAEDLRQLQNLFKVGNGLCALPFGDGLPCYIQFFRKLLLRPAAFFSKLDDLIRKNHITAPHCFVAGAWCAPGCFQHTPPGGCAPPTGAGQCVNRWLQVVIFLRGILWNSIP